MSECDRQSGNFRLRERLKTSTPIAVLDKYKFFEVTKLLEDKVNQYLYFGASMFWRFGVRRWQFGGGKIGPIKLGPYQEQLRLYLLGKAGFPSDGRLIVQVSSESDVTDVVLAPSSGRSDVGRFHRFYMLGLLFTLHLGQQVAGSVYDAFALNASAGKFMVLCPWRDDPLFRHLRSFVKSSPATSILLDRLSHTVS